MFLAQLLCHVNLHKYDPWEIGISANDINLAHFYCARCQKRIFTVREVNLNDSQRIPYELIRSTLDEQQVR